MAATATERYSDRGQRRTIDGNWEARRGWDVSNYIEPDDAIAATGVDVGDAHPLYAPLKCVDISPVDDRLSLNRVVAIYRVTSLQASNLNPLLRNPFIRRRPLKSTEQIDTDLNGNSILNAAGDGFRTKVTRNFTSRTFTIIRYEAFYDEDLADAITDTVNGDTITFNGRTYNPGQVYCSAYYPVEDYQLGCDYLKVAYDFEIRTPNYPGLAPLQVRHPFQARILNQGMQGRCRTSDQQPNDPPILDYFYTKQRNRATTDVLLDVDGTPLNDSIKIGASGLDPVSYDLQDNVLTEAGAEDPNTGYAMATFMIYMRYAEVPFSGIGVSG